MSFIVKIETGNAAMSGGRDVAAVLREVAERLERGEEAGNVRDANGNTVGGWELSLPPCL